MRNLNEAGDHLFPRMSQCLSNWSVDFRLEALNGSLDDASCGEVGVRFVRELLETLPEEEHDLNLSGDLAMLYFALHRDAEAERCCQKLIHNHPDCAVGYIVLSDGLIGSSRNRPAPPVRLQRAIELLEAALAYPVKDADDFDVPARLARARALLLKARHSGQ
jgi:hypothetical protein